MQLTKQQIVGLIGSLMLIAGLFFPMVNIPMLGERNFFEVGNFSGLLDYSLTGVAYGIVALAVACILLSLLNYCRGLFIAGLIAIAVFGLTLKQFDDVGKMLKDNAATNFIMNITNTHVDGGNLRWGWIVLFAATLVLIVASFLKSEPKEGLQ